MVIDLLLQFVNERVQRSSPIDCSEEPFAQWAFYAIGGGRPMKGLQPAIRLTPAAVIISLCFILLVSAAVDARLDGFDLVSKMSIWNCISTVKQQRSQL